MFKQLIILAAATSLVGCAAQKRANEQNQARFNETIPVCVDEKDCAAKWDAAQLWIVHHAGYKLQTTTNVLLETYNATGSSPALSVRVTKEPLGGGKYKLIVRTWCDNFLGCSPDAWGAALDFNNQVAAAKP